MSLILIKIWLWRKAELFIWDFPYVFSAPHLHKQSQWAAPELLKGRTWFIAFLVSLLCSASAAQRFPRLWMGAECGMGSASTRKYLGTHPLFVCCCLHGFLLEDSAVCSQLSTSTRLPQSHCKNSRDGKMQRRGKEKSHDRSSVRYLK